MSVQPSAQAQPAQPQPAQPQPAQPQPAQAQPAQAQPAHNEEAINNLIALSGQTREHVIRCLDLAKGDPNVAFEICMIPPEQLAQMAAQMQGAGAGGYGDEDMGDDAYGDELDGASGLANFLNNPNFQ